MNPYIAKFAHEFPHVLKTEERQKTVIDVDGHKIGGDTFTIFAGPCRVESREQISECASYLKSAGAHVLRGGAYKPCTSPIADWGREETALEELASAGKAAGIPVITEAMDEHQLSVVDKYTDIIQTGMRNAQNYTFFRHLGNTYTKPVFMKRGSWMDLREILASAEWIAYDDPERGQKGNPNVMICERGVVGLNKHMRWTLDLAIVPSIKTVSHLPVIVDISHGTGGEGNTEYYNDLARAAVAVGADGLMVEVHPQPEKSASDAVQTIGFKEFDELVEAIRPVVEAVGKKL